MSQEELAFRMDVTRQAVYKWESGTATPEVEKIKLLAKMFNVSFDYLMNDEINTIEAPAEQKPVDRRPVFFTGTYPHYNQADLDSGSSEKILNKYADQTIEERKRIATSYLKEMGATEVNFLQPGAATAFFYDAKRCVVGFYYYGQIQFVCPIESILDFQYSGGGQNLYNTTTSAVGVGIGRGGFGVGGGRAPTVRTSTDGCVSVSLTYYHAGSPKEFRFELNAVNWYDFESYKNDGNVDIEAVKTLKIEYILSHLKAAHSKITSLRVLGQDILNGTRTPAPFDHAFYREKNKPKLQEYNNFLHSVQTFTRPGIKKRPTGAVGLAIGIGLLAALAIALIIGFLAT